MRHTLRSLAKNPAFSLTVIVIIALSIGSCTAIFSLVKAVLLTDLPYDDAQKPLVVIWHTDANAAGVTGIWARDYLTYRDTTRSFESVSAITTQGYNLNEGLDPVRLICGRVTANLFPTLGVMPLRGRWFAAEEDQEGANRAVVLSHGLWRSRFGSDESVVGKTIHLDLKPHTVVGIMPESFSFPPQGVQGVANSECWIPASLSQAEMALPNFNWVVVARVKQGVSMDQARQDSAAAAQRILESYPAAVQKEVALRARVIPLREQIAAASKTPLLVFCGAVGLLLLIGCANAANLLLARLHVRQREFAIRQAMGATHLGIVNQLLVECVVIAGCGGIAGLPVAWWSLRLLAAFAPGNVPRIDQVRIDAFTVIFAIGCSIFAGLLFGIAPALRSREFNIAETLVEGVRGSSAGGRHKLRSALAVVEIAMALVLLIGAGLLLRSFTKLMNVDPGFSTENVLTFSVALPAEKYQQTVQTNSFSRAVLDRMHRFPAVRHAAVGTSLPIGTTEYTVISRIDAPPGAAGFKPAAIQIVSEEYLQALGIALKQGRSFETSDDAAGLPVAIINEVMARQYWPDSNAVGQQMRWLTGQRNVTVVGVVADVRQAGLAEAPTPTFYVPLEQSPAPVRNLNVVIRGSEQIASLGPAVRKAVMEVDAALPIFRLQTGDELVSQSRITPRFHMFVVTAFAISALVLAALGLFAVISYLVSQSSREFGIRIALGATPHEILRMVMARGLGLASLGALIGTCGAFGLTRFLSGMLFGITSTDAVTFFGSIALVMGVAIIATLMPAIRATRVDPVTSLRLE